MNFTDKVVVCSWSGGIDSTAVLACLLHRGARVHAVSLDMYSGWFAARERRARRRLGPALVALSRRHGGSISFYERDAPWIWAFSPDGREIPRRNKHIIDHLATSWAEFLDAKLIGMGEYVGADSWLVRDHVGAADADARSLASYLYQEYGLERQLVTLADFGESRYKVDRLRLGVEAGGFSLMADTTNCLTDFEEHCGCCYKCFERRAAFELLGRGDPTPYLSDPAEANPDLLNQYRRQMRGEKVSAPYSSMGSMLLPAPISTAYCEFPK